MFIYGKLELCMHCLVKVCFDDKFVPNKNIFAFLNANPESAYIITILQRRAVVRFCQMLHLSNADWHIATRCLLNPAYM